jgi:hypothetical protein
VKCPNYGGNHKVYHRSCQVRAAAMDKQGKRVEEERPRKTGGIQLKRRRAGKRKEKETLHGALQSSGPRRQ